MERNAGRAPLVELLDRIVRDADRADLAGLQQLFARARGFRDRIVRGPVLLEEVDVVDAETAQAGVALGDHVGVAGGARVHRRVGAHAELREDGEAGVTPAAPCIARPTIVSEWPPP